MKRYPKYETCDLMHDGICVSKPCICKGMSMAEKKKQWREDRNKRKKESLK